MNKVDNLNLKRKVAWIDEANCIGCNKCAKICPVNAIVGTTNQMHTILESICIGCDLCIAHCPTDCISYTTKS